MTEGGAELAGTFLPHSQSGWDLVHLHLAVQCPSFVSKVQYSAVQYTAVEYSTVQYSTVQ